MLSLQSMDGCIGGSDNGKRIERCGRKAPGLQPAPSSVRVTTAELPKFERSSGT